MLMTVLTVNSFATVHHVVYGTTSNVTCFSGDTLRFEDFTSTPTMVSIQTTSGPTVITSPIYTTPAMSGKIVDYVITGSETAFQMNHSSGYWPGTITVSITTGINSYTESESSIKAFPNPCVNILKINTPVDIKLNVFNINGQLVMTKDLFEGVNDIDVESLSSGIYFATMKTKTIKIVKQ